MVITMTAGTVMIMWLGELITDRGIGNGMSILMFVSIAAGFPGSLWAIKVSGKIAGGWVEFLAVIASASRWSAWSSSSSRRSAGSRCSTRSA